ncbi:hypothetical protein ABH924_002324 [Arthrobacter sp. GAS37]
MIIVYIRMGDFVWIFNEKYILWQLWMHIAAP